MTTWPRLWLPLCGALLIATTPAAQAQDYPNRPINVIVPFPAGGLTDVPARIAATMMSEKIGQNLVVENKTGATRHDRRRASRRVRRRTATRCSPIRSPTRRISTSRR